MNNKDISQKVIDKNKEGNFWDQKPLPNIVIDNFLPEEFANALEIEAKNYSTFTPTNDYIFAKNKFGSHNLSDIGTNMSKLRNLLISNDFEKALTEVFGHEIFVDSHFIGGGLHRGGKNSYLDMHVDFQKHPSENWMRELNILYFLNRDWKQEYGGSLKLENSKSGEKCEIEPIFNRLVIMHTSDYTYHGYSPVNFPDGRYRMSVATYSYRIPLPHEDTSSQRTTTVWRPTSKLRSIVARVTPALVQTKQKLFGSRTARHK